MPDLRSWRAWLRTTGPLTQGASNRGRRVSTRVRREIIKHAACTYRRAPWVPSRGVGIAVARPFGTPPIPRGHAMVNSPPLGVFVAGRLRPRCYTVSHGHVFAKVVSVPPAKGGARMPARCTPGSSCAVDPRTAPSSCTDRPTDLRWSGSPKWKNEAGAFPSQYRDV
jgi:hypothetical protein